MEAAIAQLRTYAATADEATRKTVIKALRDLSDSLETDDDTVTRMWGLPVQASVVRTGIDLKIFDILQASSGSLTLQELSDKTSCAPLLLARLLRTLAAFGIIQETDRDTFAASKLTKTLANKGHQACLKHYFDACGPVYQAMPAALKNKGYHDLVDADHTVWQDAHNCQENCFQWMMSHPNNFQNFNEYMASRREHQITWLDVYPLREDASGLSADRPLFVDVGGSIGHSCAEFKAKYPDLSGQVVLQDLPFAVEHALPTSGVTNLAHDFFTQQPIKGAKFYYMRAVLHDWPDAKCKLILKNTIDALAEDSIIIIDDIVTPNKGVNWQITQIDITMMAAGASLERTEAQWAALYDEMGLKIHRRLVYTPGMHETVTALVRK